MADELQLMQDFIVDTLAADTTLVSYVGGRIYVGSAPQPAAYPFILIEYLNPARPFGMGTYSTGSGDFMTHNARRIWTAHSWRVTGRINKRSMSSLSDIADRIDELLHAPSRTVIPVDGGEIISSVRENPYQRTEEEDAIIYSVKGHDFVITAKAV